jgi:hypothetical protein
MTAEIAKSRIVAIAREMLAGKLDIIAGCDAINRERPGLRNSELLSDVLLPFIAFDSEMDSFPVGASRQYWTEQALATEDARLRPILESARPEIMKACCDLIAAWGGSPN